MSTSTDAVRTTGVESTTQAVVSAVATERGVDPIDLEPLYTVLDPDALDALFQRDGSGATQGSARVEFTYAGCEVCVAADGSVETAVLDN